MDLNFTRKQLNNGLKSVKLQMTHGSGSDHSHVRPATQQNEHVKPRAEYNAVPRHAINSKLSGVCSSFWNSLVNGNPGKPQHHFLPTHRPPKKMLSSSDAKWRCMWHMLIWSVSLTLVSQFLHIKDHIAFFILAAVSMIVLPMITAVYNNTSGKHGSELLRVGYVICDPVIACITVTPLLIFNRLPAIVAEYNCIRMHRQWNATYWCLLNQTDVKDISPYNDVTDENCQWEALERQKRGEFLVVQASTFVPALLCLFMGTRSRKMTYNTHFVTFIYWLVSSVEVADLLEYTLLHDSYKHVIYTTEAIAAIVSIITHSYAVVTLCSYITPMRTEINKEFRKKFDFLYQAFVAISGVLFTEIPLLVARVQIIVGDTTRLLPGPFYMWLVKDMLFIILLVAMLLCQKVGRKKSTEMLCTINLDTPNVIFQPEKRDAYIVKKKSVRFKEPLSTTYDSEEEICMKDKKLSKLADYIQDTVSVSHDSGLNKIAQDKLSHKKKARKWKPDSPNGSTISDESKKVSSNPELTYDGGSSTNLKSVTKDMCSEVSKNWEASTESLS